jgi:trimeric autotransporter adhesin
LAFLQHGIQINHDSPYGNWNYFFMKYSLPLMGLVLLGGGFVACAQDQSMTLSPLWSLAPGSRAYVAADNNQRGLAYNPATDHVLLANRTGGLSVNVLSATTGADLGTLDVTGITGGTFVLNLVGTGSDGAIYGCNLTTDSTTTPFKLYRWANESSAPQLVYTGDPSLADTSGLANSKRFGDSMDVRGSGSSTQILLGSRGGTYASILSTTDGSTFSVNKLSITGSSGGDVGLGLAFGTNNTFWGTAPGKNIKLISYDLGAGTGSILQDYGATNVPTSVATIGVDPDKKFLAGINLATPDTILFYDISGATPVLWDTKLTAKGDPDNANANGTGAVDFSSGALFVLDSNNGISAFRVVPEPTTGALLVLGLAALVMNAQRRKR